MPVMKLNEVCKVRNDAIGGDGKSYTFALFKKANKKTARITVIHDKLTSSQDVTVPFEALWRLKFTTRRALERKIASLEKNEASPPPEKPTNTNAPLFTEARDTDQPMIDGLKCIEELPIHGSTAILTIAADSVTNCNTGAIVNAANEGCLGGGGIDGRIGDLGGDALYQARLALPVIPGTLSSRVLTGNAVTTIAGRLPCQHIIHAVGPNFYAYESKEVAMALLKDAYKNAMLRASELKLQKVAFCILSAGIFRGTCSLREIVAAGIVSIAQSVYPELERVYFCAFTHQEQYAVRELTSMYRP